MSIELIIAVIGFICTAFFSGAEMAYIAANPMQIEVWKRQKISGADESSRMLARPLSVFHLTLTGTIFSNMIAASFATLVFIQHYHIIFIIIILALILLTFGDILPKTIFRERANRMTLRVTPILTFFSYLLYPLVKISSAYSHLLTNWFKSDEEPSQALLKNELRLLFSEVGTRDGIEPHEKQFISKLFSFGQQTAREVMTPRTDISAVEVSKSLEETKQVFLDSGHSKLPIYKETIDHIVGMVFLHDMFDPHESLQEIVRQAAFVPESKNIGEQLREFQENKNSIGIVIDEYGGTAGLITIEDIVEELFGEFEDEFDFEEVTVKKTDNGYIMSARAEIDYLNETLHLGIPEGDYETLGGFLEDRLGRIPGTGEEFSFGKLKFTITKASQKKIEQVKLLRLDESELLPSPPASI
ncbi:MAG TPA: hemolysin family protein [bacterium]|nr:hemolysin family protein [bacterium]